MGLPDGTDKCADINAAITKMIESGEWQKALDKNTEGTGYKPNAETNPPTLSDSCA